MNGTECNLTWCEWNAVVYGWTQETWAKAMREFCSLYGAAPSKVLWGGWR